MSITSKIDELFIKDQTPSIYNQPSWNTVPNPIKPFYVMSRHNIGPAVKNFQFSLAPNSIIECRLGISGIKIFCEPQFAQQITQLFHLHTKTSAFIHAIKHMSPLNQHCYISLPNVVIRHYDVINAITTAFNLNILNIDIIFKITDMRNSKVKCELDWDRNILNDMTAEFEIFKMFSMQVHGNDNGFIFDPLSGIPLTLYVDPVGNFIWKDFDFHHTDLLNNVRFNTIFKSPSDLMKCKSLFIKDYMKLIDLHTGMPCTKSTHNIAHQSCSVGRQNYQSLITKHNISLWYLQTNNNFNQYIEWLMRKIVAAGGDINKFENDYINHYGSLPSLLTHLTKI